MFDYRGTLRCGLCVVQAALGQYWGPADRSSAAMPGMLLWAKRSLEAALENFT